MRFILLFNTNPKSNLFPKLNFLIKKFNFRNNFVLRFKDKIQLTKILKKNFKFNKKVKFIYVEHHLSHISSAFFCIKI